MASHVYRADRASPAAPRRSALGGVGEQPGERLGEVRRVRAARIPDRVSADLREGEPVGGEHGGTAGHRLEDRQAEPLPVRGVRDDLRPAEQRRQQPVRDEPGPQDAQRAGQLRHRRVDGVVPALAAGEDENRWLVETRRNAAEGADQRGHVLARLEGAEEGDVRLVRRDAEPLPQLGHLGLGGRPEPLVVDAVRDHGDP